ncbi:hypothetical protein O9993_19640 [Vibrio lentus]|nr:hypothetical protein [Vibrio lentus]
MAVLGQMSASISHELNNPLAAIRSYADNGRLFLAKEKTDRKVDDNFIADLQRSPIEWLNQIPTSLFCQEILTAEELHTRYKSYRFFIPQKRTDEASTQERERVKINELPDAFDVRVVANAIQLEQVVINSADQCHSSNGSTRRQAIVHLVEIRPPSTNTDTTSTLLIHIDDNGSDFLTFER